MILDTSAVIAIVRDEPARGQLARALVDAVQCSMSAATRVELSAVLARSLDAQDARRADRILEQARVEVIAFDAEQARIASEAYRLFGRGSGHRANLNLGDCFSYALAIARDEPLLFVGDDFNHTDVRVVALDTSKRKD